MDITQIICAALSGVSAIMVAIVTRVTMKNNEKADKQAELRAKEGRLQLEMIHANTELTVGCAMAIKNGHANGELERGLTMVNEVGSKYQSFLEGIAIEQLKK